MLFGRRGGERRRRAPSARTHHERPPCRSWTGDTSFTRSKGPCTSIVTQLRRRKPSGVARSRRYRGRANPRKWEEPAPGPSRTGVARLAACLPLRRATCGGSVARKKRKEVAASVPARNRELRLGCSYVGYAVAEVARRRLASNTLAHGAPKRATTRVNGGLARGKRRR
jgi:hypothetical protein